MRPLSRAPELDPPPGPAHCVCHGLGLSGSYRHWELVAGGTPPPQSSLDLQERARRGGTASPRPPTPLISGSARRTTPCAGCKTGAPPPRQAHTECDVSPRSPPTHPSATCFQPRSGRFAHRPQAPEVGTATARPALSCRRAAPALASPQKGAAAAQPHAPPRPLACLFSFSPPLFFPLVSPSTLCLCVIFPSPPPGGWWPLWGLCPTTPLEGGHGPPPPCPPARCRVWPCLTGGLGASVAGLTGPPEPRVPPVHRAPPPPPLPARGCAAPPHTTASQPARCGACHPSDHRTRHPSALLRHHHHHHQRVAVCRTRLAPPRPPTPPTPGRDCVPGRRPCGVCSPRTREAPGWLLAGVTSWDRPRSPPPPPLPHLRASHDPVGSCGTRGSSWSPTSRRRRCVSADLGPALVQRPGRWQLVALRHRALGRNAGRRGGSSASTVIGGRICGGAGPLTPASGRHATCRLWRRVAVGGWGTRGVSLERGARGRRSPP